MTDRQVGARPDSISMAAVKDWHNAELDVLIAQIDKLRREDKRDSAKLVYRKCAALVEAAKKG